MYIVLPSSLTVLQRLLG